MVKTSATLVPITDVVPTGARGTDPEFDRARELHRVERAKAGPHLAAAVALADEINRLRERYTGEGHGGPRKGSSFTPVKLDRPATGFVAKLEAELGLHPQQAKRLEERADYVRRLRLAAEGQPVPYETGTGKAKKQVTFTPDAQAAQIAGTLLDAALAGDVPPSRAWAGVTGEGQRRASQGGEATRQPVNHYKNCERAQAKFATSLEHYYDFSEDEQGYLTSTWGELLAGGVIPEKWLRMAADHLKAKGGRP